MVVDRTISPPEVPTPGPPPLTGSTLMAAPHGSRRREAVRVIHRDRHLFVDDLENDLSARAAAADALERVDPVVSAGGVRKVRTVGTRWLIALILLGFGIAHVIGATVLDASRPPATDTQEE
jgi:hypothetical protein